jgi:hypothetical protein
LPIRLSRPQSTSWSLTRFSCSLSLSLLSDDWFASLQNVSAFYGTRLQTSFKNAKLGLFYRGMFPFLRLNAPRLLPLIQITYSMKSKLESDRKLDKWRRLLRFSFHSPSLSFSGLKSPCFLQDWMIANRCHRDSCIVAFGGTSFLP